MADEKRLIEIPCDGIVRIPIMRGQDTVGEKIVDLSHFPTVDAVEVVHGRWLFVTRGQQTSVYVCSRCNRAVTVSCDEDKVKGQLIKRYPYCHCGAQMDGGEEDA